MNYFYKGEDESNYLPNNRHYYPADSQAPVFYAPENDSISGNSLSLHQEVNPMNRIAGSQQYYRDYPQSEIYQTPWRATPPFGWQSRDYLNSFLQGGAEAAQPVQEVPQPTAPQRPISRGYSIWDADDSHLRWPYFTQRQPTPTASPQQPAVQEEPQPTAPKHPSLWGYSIWDADDSHLRWPYFAQQQPTPTASPQQPAVQEEPFLQEPTPIVAPEATRLAAQDSAVQMPPDTTAVQPENILQKLPFLPTTEEAAAMASHVYGDKNTPPLPNGWTISDELEKKGITINTQNGLKAQLYERTNEKGETSYALVFAGTDFGKKDIIADISQLLGSSKQYEDAIKLGQEVYKALGGNVVFIGHSLGGGEAAASAYKTGGQAITFNPAALSRRTKQNYEINTDNGTVTNHIIETDPLNFFQSIFMRADGEKVSHSLEPNDWFLNSGAYLYKIWNSHSIDSFNNNQLFFREK